MRAQFSTVMRQSVLSAVFHLFSVITSNHVFPIYKYLKKYQCKMQGSIGRPTGLIARTTQRLYKRINMLLSAHTGRCGGLMVSALDSGASGPGLSPGQGHCVVFLSKTLYSHSNLRSGVPYIFCCGGKVRLIQLLDYLSAAP